MIRRLIRLARTLVLVVVVVIVTVLAVRIVDTLRGPELEPWHTVVPPELDAAELDRTDWAGWLAAEDKAFAAVRSEVTEALPAADRVPYNRYFDGSPIYTPALTHDWNRSYELLPKGEIKGAAVFIHGLTDSPYSLRHVAELYRDRGFVAVGLRVPGHGTVPGGLTEGTWQDWLAATRLAMREAARQAGPGKPLHILGYSNGGALALLYALEAQKDPARPQPAEVVLFSPMVGVTEFARFAGLAGLPAFLPAFARTAWLNILPEFNPFKYNSFPVNAARQSYLLTQALQSELRAQDGGGTLRGFPPVLTFQSVLDQTVLTSAIVSSLHGVLSGGNSELVLYDINRNAAVDAAELFRPRTLEATGRVLPPAPRPFRTTLITNVSRDSAAVEARTTEAGSTQETRTPIGASYPRGVYSLSHIAVPFPLWDGLYGLYPAGTPDEDFGIEIGNVAARGERGALVVDKDFLMRMSSNPFYDDMMARIAARLPPAQ